MTVDTEQLRHVVQAATLAPSVHNTQPWRFVAGPDGFDLRAERSRQLPVLDPTGRQLHLSCGAALANARVAARGVGLDASVLLLPSSDADLLASVVLVSGPPATAAEVSLAEAVLTRHTTRGAFAAAPVDPTVVERLLGIVEAEGAMLRPVRPDEVVEVQVLLSQADALEETDPAYRAELAAWVHPADDAEGDGIPPTALAALTGRGSSWRLRDFALAAPEHSSGDAPPVERPEVAVLTTVGDQPADWLRAGQALELLLLHAAVAGVQAQPLGQVTDTEAPRRRLRAALGLVGVPQLVLRLGYAAGTAGTARRALDDVLV